MEQKKSSVAKLYEAKVALRAALILRAINNKVREKLLSVIEANPGITVSEIYTKKYKMEQSVCSQHLAILREAGIVTATRKGKWMSYSISDKNVDQVLSAAVDILNIVSGHKIKK